MRRPHLAGTTRRRPNPPRDRLPKHWRRSGLPPERRRASKAGLPMNQPGPVPVRDPTRPPGRRQTPPRLRSPGPVAKTPQGLRRCLRARRCGPAVRWPVVLAKWSSRWPVAGRSSTSGTAASGMPLDVGRFRPGGTRCGFSATGKVRECAAGSSFAPASRRRSGCDSGPANTAGVLRWACSFNPWRLMRLHRSASPASGWWNSWTRRSQSVHCAVHGEHFGALGDGGSDVRGPRKLLTAGTAAQSPWGSTSTSCCRALALGPWGKRCR